MVNSKVEACQNQAMGIHRCKNKSQCFEPCGDLGHSEEHVKLIDDMASEVMVTAVKSLKRTAFEKWYAVKKGDQWPYRINFENNEYQDTATNLSWVAWKAAWEHLDA